MEKQPLFDHEKLHVYQISLEFVKWVFETARTLTGPYRFARDELIRASQSIPRNIAEGNGKRSSLDRCRFFDIARGSSFECASIIDQLHIIGAIEQQKVDEGKRMLHRIVCMLVKITERFDQVKEDGIANYEYSD